MGFEGSEVSIVSDVFGEGSSRGRGAAAEKAVSPQVGCLCGGVKKFAYEDRRVWDGLWWWSMLTRWVGPGSGGLREWENRRGIGSQQSLWSTGVMWPRLQQSCGHIGSLFRSLESVP